MPPIRLSQLVNNMKLYLLLGPALASGALRK
jgi:hypothetical protein